MSKVIHSFPLSGLINNNLHIFCSEKGHVAVINEENVIVLKLKTDLATQPNLSSIDISTVSVSSEYIPYCEKFVISNEEAACSIETGELTYDFTLWPGQQPLCCSKTVRQCLWSPSGMDSNNSCLLTVLLHSHDLAIYHNPKNQSWDKVCSLAALWQRYLKSTSSNDVLNRGTDADAKLGTFRAFQLYCYKQSAVEASWSPLINVQFGNDSLLTFSVLAVALKSGHIVLWKVITPVQSERDFAIECVLESGNALISAMSFFTIDKDNVFLCQGNNDGTAFLHSLSYTSDGKLRREMCMPIWTEADHIAVTQFCWCDKASVIVLVKGSFLVIIRLDVRCRTPVILSTAVKRTDTKYTVPKIVFLSSLCQLRVATVEGIIYVGSLSRETLDTNLELIDVKWNSPHELKIHDADWSKNGHFMVVLDSPKSYKDHVSLKRPYKIQWVAMHSFEHVADVVRNFNGNLFDVADVLTCIKYSIVTGEQLPSLLQQFINENRGQTNLLPLTQLKLLRYLLCLQRLYPYNDTDKKNIDQELVVVSQSILKSHVKSVFTLVKRLVKTQDYNYFSPEDIKVLTLMKTLLSKNSSTDEDDQLHGLSTPLSDMIGVNENVEKCAVCDASVDCCNWLVGTCENGHQFARCCQTLQLCQQVPYRVCTECKALAMQWTHPTESRKLSTFLQKLFTYQCTLCDGTLQ